VDKKPVADKEVLSPPNVNSTLDAGKCTQVRFQATGRLTPDPGEYKGLLVVLDPGAGLARQEVTISRPAPTKKPAKIAVDNIVLTATRKWPLVGTASLDIPYLPLKPVNLDEMINFPNTDAFLGVICNDGRIGQVYVNGEPDKSQKDVVRLPIRVDGLDSVGTYSGKLNVADTEDDKDAISIQVKVKDSVIYG
jgi:hypothetical protein